MSCKATQWMGYIVGLGSLLKPIIFINNTIIFQIVLPNVLRLDGCLIRSNLSLFQVHPSYTKTGEERNGPSTCS